MGDMNVRALPRHSQPRHRPYQKTKKQRKMEQETDICFTGPAALRDEICLRENDHFVGATAAFGDDWKIIPRRSHRFPDGYV